MRTIFYATVAVIAGLIVLVGAFIDIPILTSMRDHVLLWALIVAAIATWVGVANLLAVHWHKFRSRQPRSIYSLLVILAFVLTLAGGIVESFLMPDQSPLQPVVNSVQVPVEASLMALLTVSLLYAAVRLLRHRQDALAYIFIGSAVVFLVLGSGLVPLLNVPLLQELADTVSRLPLAGSRGILLGVALGSLATGIRILTAADRPYGS